MTPNKIKTISPKNEINLRLSEAVSTSKNIKTLVKTIELMTRLEYHFDMNLL